MKYTQSTRAPRRSCATKINGPFNTHTHTHHRASQCEKWSEYNKSAENHTVAHEKKTQWKQQQRPKIAVIYYKRLTRMKKFSENKFTPPQWFVCLLFIQITEICVRKRARIREWASKLTENESNIKVNAKWIREKKKKDLMKFSTPTFSFKQEKKTTTRENEHEIRERGKNKNKTKIKQKLKFILKRELNEGICIVFCRKYTIS